MILFTDASTILVDTISPQDPVATPVAGLYTSIQLVSLSSVGQTVIKYTTDGTLPTCNSGLLYLYPIGVPESLSIKTVACDEVGNTSEVKIFTYLLDLTTVSTCG